MARVAPASSASPPSLRLAAAPWRLPPCPPHAGPIRLAGMRVIVRKELPHSGAQLRFADIGGYRFTILWMRSGIAGRALVGFGVALDGR